MLQDVNKTHEIARRLLKTHILIVYNQPAPTVAADSWDANLSQKLGLVVKAAIFIEAKSLTWYQLIKIFSIVISV